MTSELLRELSHPARLKILQTIALEAKQLEKIAEKIGASVQETSTHLERLRNGGFADKHSDNSYGASPLGQVSLSLLPGLDFVGSNSGYFRDHELSLLPDRFIARLGDLREGELTEGSVTNIQRAERVIRESRGKIWVVANEVMLDVVPVIREKIDEGLDFRFIIDQTFKAPSEFEPSIPQLWRQIPKIPAVVAVTEEEAMVFFLDRKLEADYSDGFVSSEPPFQKWCEDLVEYLWDQGVSIEK